MTNAKRCFFAGLTGVLLLVGSSPSQDRSVPPSSGNNSLAKIEELLKKSKDYGSTYKVENKDKSTWISVPVGQKNNLTYVTLVPSKENGLDVLFIWCEVARYNNVSQDLFKKMAELNDGKARPGCLSYYYDGKVHTVYLNYYIPLELITTKVIDDYVSLTHDMRPKLNFAL